MSKNFELLQQVENMEQEVALKQVECGVTTSPAFPKVSSKNGSHRRLALDARSREEVVKLVHRAFLHDQSKAPRLVVFAGVDQGDGCTSVCACAAEVLSEQGFGSICVVDANFRTPSLHLFWKLENQVGLADALKEPGPIRSFAQQVPGHNLWALTSGNVPPKLHTPWNDDQLRLRIAELRKDFDNVFIDVPPANLYADAFALGHLSDGVVLVVRAGETRRQAALRAKQSFEAGNISVLGAVLNKRTYPIPQRLYEKL